MNTIPQLLCYAGARLLTRHIAPKSRICISVIIVTGNHGSYLNLTLASLEAQWFPRSAFEVVVVDVGSRDETAEVLDEYSRRGRVRVRSFTGAPDLSPVERYDLAVENALGPVLLFLDDCRILPADFLLKHLRYHTTDDKVVVGSRHCRIHTHLIADDFRDDSNTTPRCAIRPVDLFALKRWTDLMIDDEAYFDREFGVSSQQVALPIQWSRFSLANTSLPHSLWLQFPLDPSFPNADVAALDLGKRMQESGVTMIYDRQAIAVAQITDERLDQQSLDESLAVLWARHRRSGERPRKLLVGDLVVRPVVAA